MEEIEFSIFEHGAEAIELLRACLVEFEAKQHVRVRLDVLPFSGSWSKLVQMALYENGPDVSTVGTSWVGDFVRMNALRPYTPQEIRALGGGESFFEASGRSTMMLEDATAATPTWWAVPWLADLRVVCYQRDWLERAGLDPATAFQSPEQLAATLEQLRSSGTPIPLVIPTRRSRIALHTLASWIWSAGGSFLDTRTSTLAIDQPATLNGFKQYFQLGRYLVPEACDLTEAQSDEVFRSGRAAVTFGGHWLLNDQRFDPDLRSRLGVARMPGVSFSGGYHLIIWQFSRKAAAALKLVEFLAGRQAPAALFPAFGLPARKDLLTQSAIWNQPPFDLLAQTLPEARTFPSGRMWGLIEKHLVDLLPVIWRDVLASADPDIDAIVRRHIPPLVERLRISLGA